MNEEQYWDEAIYDEEEIAEDMTTYMRVNGMVLPLEVGASLTSSVKQIARDSRLGKFRLYLNGNEVFPEDDLPESIEEGMQFEMKPYDKPGRK